MKRIVLLLILLVNVSISIYGQERVKRVIELKIGLSVTGYVMEMEDGRYMLETDSGDILFYSKDEVRGIRNVDEDNKSTAKSFMSKLGFGKKKTDDASTQDVQRSNPTLEDLLLYYGIEQKLNQYKSYLVSKKKNAAEAVEDQLWEIEKEVKDEMSIPDDVRKDFVKYIESAEDRIEKEAKHERKKK